MSAEIVHAFAWDASLVQYYVTLDLGRDQLELYEASSDIGGSIARTATHDAGDIVETFAWAPECRGLVAYGGTKGTVNMVNLCTAAESSGTKPYTDLLASLRPKVQRPLSALAFNTNGVLAAGLERARGDDSLQLWDVQAQGRSGSGAGATSTAQAGVGTGSASVSTEPLVSLISQESISSVAFLPTRPTSLLCGGHKTLREVDTRMSGVVAAAATKYCQGIVVNPFDDVKFLSWSDSSVLALWDRRMLVSASTTSSAGAPSREPLLLIPRVFTDRTRAPPKTASATSFRRCVRYSTRSANEFSVLHDDRLVRRWTTSTVMAPFGASQLSNELAGVSAAATSDLPKDDTIFVNRVLDVRLEHDKVVGFDYSTPQQTNRLELFGIRQSGHVFRMEVREPACALLFDPVNNFAVASGSRLTGFDVDVREPHLTHSRETSQVQSAAPSPNLTYTNPPDSEPNVQSDWSDDSVVSDGEESLDDEIDSAISGDWKLALESDINYVMRLRARLGYSLDAQRNLKVLRGPTGASIASTGLKAAWTWIRDQPANQLVGDSVDLSYAGVASLWGGFSREALKFRSLKGDKADTGAAVRVAVARMPSVFVSPSIADQDDPDTAAVRQLALRLAGWNFELAQLEGRLLDLERRGQHEKAAAWAVFHGDVDRAVVSLARSRKKHLRLMSTAVAGYLVYKNVPNNNLWREQCRRLASEMSMPYLRAIFAYIAEPDGSWIDVLDDGALPLAERLGISLRFLAKQDLARYLHRLTTKAISHGELEGVILTGLTPTVAPLLQSYLDRSGDIQSVALLGAYAWPRFLDDERVARWKTDYRRLLDSWRYFTQRAHFDVGAARLLRAAPVARKAPIPVPRQVFLKCINCKAAICGPNDITSESGSSKQIRPLSHSRCGHCNFPLPRCAVCLLPLGPSLDDHSPGDKWPSFCLSCNHASHQVHAQQWFAKYEVCPVPKCQCLCGKM